jgi:hypothetical protein
MAFKFSKREKLLLYLLLCLSIITGGISFLVLPAFTRNSEIKSELATKEIQLQEMQIIKDSYESQLASLDELTKDTDALYENYFLNTVTDEELDVFITNIALDIGIAPQNLTINISEFLPINPYSPFSGEVEADENGDVIFGSIVTNIFVSGECSYADFISLTDAFESKTQLHISSASFESNTEKETDSIFRIGLDIYTLPPHNTGVSYFEEN